MRCLLTLLLLPVMLRADVPAQDLPQVRVKLENPATENGRNAWETPQFRIDADAIIGVEMVEKLAMLGESTAAALRAYSFPLSAPPEGLKPRISLYADALAYESAGAAKGSAGYYEGKGESRVLIRADYFLSAVVVERSRLSPDMDEDLIVHELVHLCMHRKSRGLPQWFAEGIAEYFSSAHRGAGRFSFTRMDDAVRDHLRVKLSPRDPAIRLLPVASVAALDGEGWLDMMKTLPPEERFLAYGTALLMVHYHLQGGPERLDRVV